MLLLSQRQKEKNTPGTWKIKVGITNRPFLLIVENICYFELHWETSQTIPRNIKWSKYQKFVKSPKFKKRLARTFECPFFTTLGTEECELNCLMEIGMLIFIIENVQLFLNTQLHRCPCLLFLLTRRAIVYFLKAREMHAHGQKWLFYQLVTNDRQNEIFFFVMLYAI